jgi:hypothetical protein
VIQKWFDKFSLGESLVSGGRTIIAYDVLRLVTPVGGQLAWRLARAGRQFHLWQPLRSAMD